MAGTATTQTHWTQRPDWWKPIAGIVVSLVVATALGFVLPPDAYATLLLAPVVLAGLVLALLSLAFVYLDKRYLSDAADWTPSNWYYLMPFPPLALVLPALYIYQRHERVGVPRNPLG